MLADRRILAVVPARGGSTGIKLKNLRTVGGVPLVVLAARIAVETPFIDRAVLSTDHPGIAEAGREAGLAVPFMRPEALSGPRVADWDVLVHALTEMERLDGVRYDIMVMLQPTSPGRRVEHVRSTVEKLVEGDYDAVWTVSETDSKAHPLKQLTIDPQGHLDYYDPAGACIVARQQLEPVYHRNGIAYAITRHCLLEQKSIKGARTGAVIIEDRLVNIDTEFDLVLANFLAKELSKS
ncbi:MAG TPA: acylneuraminate cytidylyltransferase family protein [Aestuariivirgaceae bacterium]|jgi:CMP-N-acetylneuraminic acid synthetase|nr:acylneuraminate cytidylyltransferase family protein [Aestuariivirgaceae bacterium]